MRTHGMPLVLGLGLVLGLSGCTKAGTPDNGVAPPTNKVAPSQVTVQMTAATLGDDCGELADASPAQPSDEEAKRNLEAEVDSSGSRHTPCEPSSMQLSVVSAAGATPTQLAITRVELFDETGKRIGEMKPRSPSVWSQTGTYQAWDQKVEPGRELQVSYVLGASPLGPGANRSARYVLKAVVSVGGGDQAVQHEVMLSAPTYLPADVET